tara:strand:- start:4818 stop:5237 length:420 start_codon:yes stop_codon:yes gene_type:complete
MWLQALQLLNPAGLIADWFQSKQNKREFKQAIHKQKLVNIQQGRIAEAEWNNTALKHASWKSQWLTLVLSTPLIGAFFPPLVPHLQEGFTVLETMPTWYQAAISVMIAASFGYKNYADTMMRRAYTLPTKENKDEKQNK